MAEQSTDPRPDDDRTGEAASDGQVSEAGSGFGDGETVVGGADAVPDKTTAAGDVTRTDQPQE